jgi:hypothetical protein
MKSDFLAACGGEEGCMSGDTPHPGKGLRPLHSKSVGESGGLHTSWQEAKSPAFQKSTSMRGLLSHLILHLLPRMALSLCSQGNNGIKFCRTHCRIEAKTDTNGG